MRTLTKVLFVLFLFTAIAVGMPPGADARCHRHRLGIRQRIADRIERRRGSSCEPATPKPAPKKAALREDAELIPGPRPTY